jgi:CRP/FNR family transcriptional regulator, cyclic AMP receptor protein
MALTPDFLRNIEFFRGFTDESLADLIGASTTSTFHRGDTIFSETDDANHLYIVETGRIAISNKSFDGRESVLALMGPGDLFGEMALFDEQGRSAGARALETSEVHSIGYGPLRSYFEQDAKALWNVVRLLISRVRSADEALADSVFLDVTGRTAKRLLDIAAGKDEFTLPITQEELAGMIGASRERVNKAIAAFVRLGWLEQRDRTYRIVERKKMTNRAS